MNKNNSKFLSSWHIWWMKIMKKGVSYTDRQIPTVLRIKQGLGVGVVTTAGATLFLLLLTLRGAPGPGSRPVNQF